jgi:hypothetical protein
MVDMPGRAGFEPDGRADGGDDGGWGSPLPAEYGSLRAVRPAPPPEERPDRSDRADRIGADRQQRRHVTSLLRRIQGESAGAALAAAGGPLTVEPKRRVPRRPPDRTADRAPDRRAPEPEPELRRVRGLPPAEPTTAASPISTAPPPTAAPLVTSADPATAAAPITTAPPATVAMPVVDAAAPGAVDPLTLGIAPRAGAVSRRRSRARPTRVRSRATVRHVDVMTVVRVSVVFYLVVMLALVTASVLLWVFADTFGALPSLEKSIRTLFSLKSFVLHPATVAYYTAAAGIVLCVAGTFTNILAALIYNLIADVVGGVRVELESFSRE